MLVKGSDWVVLAKEEAGRLKCISSGDGILRPTRGLEAVLSAL
jgi:hypothetical protein